MLAALLTVIGCTDPGSVTVTDQCLRTTLFQQCMAALPKGPERVGTSNDWDEVVGACESTAYYRALRQRQFVKPECAL